MTAPADVGRGEGADVLRGQAKGGFVLQHGANGADDGDLEPVEHPGDAEGNDDEQVKTAPRQPIEPRRNIGLEHRVPLICKSFLVLFFKKEQFFF